MAAKSANLYARIEPDVKEKAESILSTLGIPASSAINMFYKQIILQRGLPFEVKLPSSRPVDIHTVSETEFNEELEKGYSDMQAERTKNAKKAFADIILISTKAFLSLIFLIYHKILQTDFIRRNICKVDTAVSHTIDQMQDIRKWCRKACFTFSFIDTLYMCFSHLQIQIHDLIFPFDQLLCLN